MKAFVVAASLALAASTAQAGEARLAAGFFLLADDGIDFHASYRAEQSHWQWGLRFVRYTEEYGFDGTAVSRTTTTKVGPTVSYLFRPDERGSWYLGASLLDWRQKEKSQRTGTVDEDSGVAPFFGGGYTGRLGAHGFYNLGLFLSPAKRSTQTADSAEEGTGADVQLQIGLAF
jgi:hypothetical protein